MIPNKHTSFRWGGTTQFSKSCKWYSGLLYI